MKREDDLIKNKKLPQIALQYFLNIAYLIELLFLYSFCIPCITVECDIINALIYFSINICIVVFLITEMVQTADVDLSKVFECVLCSKGECNGQYKKCEQPKKNANVNASTLTLKTCGRFSAKSLRA